MNKYIYHLILIIISFLLFVFERDNMFSEDIVTNNISGTIIVIIMLFLATYAVLFSSRDKKIIKDKVYKRYIALSILIYIVSITFSIIYPFGGRVTYGTIILPLLLFLFTANCSKYAENDNMIIWCMTIVAVMLFYYYISNYFGNIMYEQDTQSNASYPILYLLPFMLCHKNKALRIVFIIMVLIVVMFSLKRGGIIALSCGLITYFYVSQIAIKSRKIGIIPIISFIIIIIGFLYFIRYFNENILSGMLSDRLIDSVDSKGSGRLDIYRYYWDVFKDSSLFQLIIGRGWIGSIKSGSVGLSCHNDFLEVLIDFGIIGLIFYLTFITSLIKFCGGMIKIKHEYAPAMGASIGLFLVNSMVSHIIIYSSYLILFSLFWGFMLYSMNNQYVKK